VNKFYPVVTTKPNGTRIFHIGGYAPQTNMTRETRTEGWLGSSNGYSATALGEYETLDEAKAACRKAGLRKRAWDEELMPDFRDRTGQKYFVAGYRCEQP
jgi:hypothetical protein